MSENQTSKILNSDRRALFHCFHTNKMLNLRDVDVMVCQKCNTTYFKQIKYQISRVANKQEDQCSRPTLASQSV